jgi:predicted RNA polymerase sigma factor
MAQRISRAKRTVSGVRFDQPGDVATVLRVRYLVFNEGYSGDVDLAAEAIRLNRAVAVGEADGPRAGLAALGALDDSLPRYTAVAAYLHERDGDLATAARLYAEAAQQASNLAERDHLTRQAARLNTGRRR